MGSSNHLHLYIDYMKKRVAFDFLIELILFIMLASGLTTLLIGAIAFAIYVASISVVLSIFMLLSVIMTIVYIVYELND